MKLKIYISIATYNEKENIEKLIREIFALSVDDLSVIVVDDNSPDGTAQIVENLRAEFHSLHLIKRSGKLGYGSAHIAGFKKAIASGAEIIISMDADFSHNPRIIPELIRAIEGGNEVAIGSRKIKGGQVVGWSWWRKFASTGAMLASQIVLGIKTRDLTSGFRAYKKEVFDRIDLDKIHSNGYSFLEELIYLVEKNGFKIKEVPIVFYDRRLGHSKLSRTEIVKFFITIFRIKFGRPILPPLDKGRQPRESVAEGSRLLMITRKVDRNDALAGFTYNWVKKIGQRVDKLFVITWQKSDRGDLPENVEIISLPENRLNKIFVLPKIVAKLRPQVDGIFCHMNPEYTILAALRAKIFCGRKNRKKIVSWYTHKAVTWRRHLMEKYADVILTASPESFRQPKYPAKVKAVGHGINLDIFKPVAKSNNEGIFHVFSVGRISPTKDYESIIKAVAINKSLPISLSIIGGAAKKVDIQYLKSLNLLVKNLGLDFGIGKCNKYDKIRFWGWRPNIEVPMNFQTADLFINMSGTGSLDKAVLEAMACGCLVLTSNEAFKPILPEILMVEKDNPAALAEKIKMIMNLSEVEKDELRQKLIQEVKINHNLDSLVDKIINEFK